MPRITPQYEQAQQKRIIDGAAQIFADHGYRPTTIDQISQALKIFADTSGGHYPQAKRFYFDIIFAELHMLIGIEGLPTPEQRNGEKYTRIEGSRLGFIQISLLQESNADFAYYGKTIGPNDKDKVLLRWKLDDGKYAIIYGDLHNEIVLAEQLHSLEGK